MDGSIDGRWQITTIVALALLGVRLLVHGLRRQVEGLSGPSSDSATLLTGLRGFRAAVIGLALIGVASGWLWGQTWLLVLSLGIAGEETLESSVMILAMEWRRRHP